MPKTNTKQKILDYISLNKEVSPHDLVRHLEISAQAMFRHLKTLLQQNKIIKRGSPPKVFYSLASLPKKTTVANVSSEDADFLKRHFYFISPIGDAFEGLEAMIAWTSRHHLDLDKTIMEYKKTLKKYLAYQTHNLIDGMKKMQGTFPQVYLDHLYYFDFYAIERFGKTKLGYYLLYSKQGQSISFINELIALVKPKIKNTIKQLKVDAIAFVPPTVKRELQIMKILEKECSFGLRVLSIEKIKTSIIIPQKTLSKLPDRVLNAQKTMVVTEKESFNRVLLVDDAVGSGSTLNEISRQLKEKNVCQDIVGLALTGSFKGFDVLSEV